MTGGDPGIPTKQTLAAQVAPAVAELHAEGQGRNQISRALAVSTATVSKAAKIAGVRFDRTATAAATRSRVDQLEDDRADLAAMSAAIAKRAGRRLYIEVGAPLLDADAVTALNRVFGTTADKLGKLSASITDHRDQHAAATVWLEGLRLQFDAVAAGQLDPDADGHYQINFPTPTTEETP